MKLSEKIFTCRRKAGLSQEALAEELGVSRQAVSKWETGDAVPEIGKLVALAKSFGVTTDWLLSEEEPEDKEESGQESTAENNYYYKESSAERFEKTADDWMDRVPGIFKKMVRKFGWIAGVYIAAGGAGFTALGLIAKIMVSGMMNSFNRATDSMRRSMGMGGFGGSSATFYDANGNQLSAKESAELAELLEMSGNSVSSWGGDFMESGIDAMNGMMQNNPVSILANIMIIGGLVALIGGSIFAVSWYKKSKEQK